MMTLHYWLALNGVYTYVTGIVLLELAWQASLSALCLVAQSYRKFGMLHWRFLFSCGEPKYDSALDCAVLSLVVPA